LYLCPMEIQLWCVGKTDRSFWSPAVEEYSKRIQHYIKFSIHFLPEAKAAKKSLPQQLKNDEATRLLQKIKPNDVVILLDEKGKSFSSVAFSKEIEQYMVSSTRRLIFIVGGAFGFSELLYDKFPKRMCLSSMTFSHQMVRLFFCEQLYRAFTILHNHPYHNN
jgi:23S rRNA (pseudouridine1915-N3)-methyltransferase